MKICYLLTVTASLFAFNAQANNWNMEDLMRPYLGADYVYSHAKHGGFARDAKEGYNSWSVNMGTDIGHHTSLEAFFQQAGERKAHLRDYTLKSEFYAWGLDAYGRAQVMCSNFYLLGSLGLADYNVKYKARPGGSVDKQRVGYRGGVGFGYDFTEHLGMRVMGRYSYVGMKNLDNLMEVTAGLRYYF
ncbi:MAG: porin family protein [Alphaproteobacteria bacterium]|nr:porin family protein [Alphaproteobacteria bacterium]